MSPRCLPLWAFRALHALLLTATLYPIRCAPSRPASPLPDYFVNFPNDKRMYWWLVVVLCIFGWLHTAVSIYTVYLWTVTYFAQPMLLANCPWSFAIDPVITGECRSTHARDPTAGLLQGWKPIV